MGFEGVAMVCCAGTYPQVARAILDVIRSFPGLTIDCFSMREWLVAAEAAIACRVRGADAFYVALAPQIDAELIT
jgi:predicted nucleic acid-binding protein